MKFTTVKECQTKIDRMKGLIEDFRKEAQIQFPLYDGTDESKQFQHYDIHNINRDLENLEYHVEELQKELDRYKKAVGYTLSSCDDCYKDDADPNDPTDIPSCLSMPNGCIKVLEEKYGL